MTGKIAIAPKGSTKAERSRRARKQAQAVEELSLIRQIEPDYPRELLIDCHGHGKQPFYVMCRHLVDDKKRILHVNHEGLDRQGGGGVLECDQCFAIDADDRNWGDYLPTCVCCSIGLSLITQPQTELEEKLFNKLNWQQLPKLSGPDTSFRDILWDRLHRQCIAAAKNPGLREDLQKLRAKFGGEFSDAASLNAYFRERFPVMHYAQSDIDNKVEKYKAATGVVDGDMAFWLTENHGDHSVDHTDVLTASYDAGVVTLSCRGCLIPFVSFAVAEEKATNYPGGVQSQAEFAEMAARGCPDCHDAFHKHEGIVLSGRCHPTAGVRAAYLTEKKYLGLACAECGEFVVGIQLGNKQVGYVN